VARPSLFAVLDGSAQVTVVSAPPGSGKTVLLRSWIKETGLAGRAAWVSAGRDQHDPQRFWLSVLGALRRTAPGSSLVQTLTAAPQLDGWAIVERLLTDLASLQERLWLVLDDVDVLGATDALRQLELLVMRAPQELRFVLAARHDVRLGLHRLRLEGELVEIGPSDLRFTVAEAEELFRVAGVELPVPALMTLYDRTEGWAAGLRLAALSLVGHPDPERFAAEFSGSERTVADYLVAEVLDNQREEVRRLLLRTSILERVNGPLADLLTGGAGGEGVLQDLEQANAFVVSLDGARSWFRYHQLFADLLQLELRRTAAGDIAALHRAAAGWFVPHGYLPEAIRHAQAAQDWNLAARLLADAWPGQHLDGQSSVTHELLARFPAQVRGENAELEAVAAADELAYGSLEAAERALVLAERGSTSTPADRREYLQLLLGVVRSMAARQRGNLTGAVEGARRLQTMAFAAGTPRPDLGEDLRALALISLGLPELAAYRLDEAERHLELGVALARRIGRPYLEFVGLARQAAVEFFRSFSPAAERARQAVELARRHGWTDEPTAGFASMILGSVLMWQGRLEEAEPLLQQAERTTREEAEPIRGLGILNIRGVLELARGRDADALAFFQAAERLAKRLTEPSLMAAANRSFFVQTLIRLNEMARAEQELEGLAELDRNDGDMRICVAELRLAEHDPQAASAALAPLLDGSVPFVWPARLAQPFMLEAIARESLGDSDAAERAVERALDLVEPDGAVTMLLLHPAADLLERHARHGTAHASLIADVQNVLAGRERASTAARPQALYEPLRDSEIRVLRYLPTNLTAPEIARELFVSTNTVKTHMRNLYTKLDAHRRRDAVARARALGLLAPSGLGRGQ
jgi:LuxR family transcriptional regulator, maltose regulon positive regulatory protein